MKQKVSVKPFILCYNDFGKEWTARVNERFKGTRAELPEDLQPNQELENMHLIKRLGLITASYHNPQLRSTNILSVTPLQFEQLLQANNLPKDPRTYWENLALALYDRSSKGSNLKEAQALHVSLQQHRTELGLSSADLEQRLLIVHAGLEKDDSMPHGVKPVILPGLTEVYVHDTLRLGGVYLFAYGLDRGLPAVKTLGNGSRRLYLPQGKNIGLRALFRGRDLGLLAWDMGLVYSDADGRVTCARQGAQKS